MWSSIFGSPITLLSSMLGSISSIVGLVILIHDAFSKKKISKKAWVLLLVGILILSLALALGANAEAEASRISVSDVTLSHTELSLIVGDNASLLATVAYTDNTIGHSAIWFSSDPQIAKIDKTGNITALSPGHVTVTAQASRNNTVQKATCDIVVSEPPHIPSGYSIRLSAKQAILWETFDVYVEPYEDDVTDIVIYAVSPSGDTMPFEYDPSKNGYMIYTEAGAWTIYASVTNSAGTYTAQKPQDYVTIEIISLEDALGDMVGG